MNRLITAIGLIAVALYLVFLSPPLVFLAAALAMSFLCYREFASLVEANGLPAPGSAGIPLGVFLLFWPEISRPSIDLLAGVSLLAVIMLTLALYRSSLEKILPKVACALFGAWYTFAPWRFAVDLRSQSVHLAFFALALNWIGDSAAYYAGRLFGRHKLAPVISPKKTMEGAAASVAASVIFAILYLGHFFPRLPWGEAVVLATAGNVAGQLGDLVESAIKRGAGVKDSGSLLPGHGGILDRVDSSLFTLPVVFVIYRLMPR